MVSPNSKFSQKLVHSKVILSVSTSASALCAYYWHQIFVQFASFPSNSRTDILIITMWVSSIYKPIYHKNQNNSSGGLIFRILVNHSDSLVHWPRTDVSLCHIDVSLGHLIPQVLTAACKDDTFIIWKESGTEKCLSVLLKLWEIAAAAFSTWPFLSHGEGEGKKP